MKFKGNISITRDSRNNINIRLRDKVSYIEFVDVYMSLEDFAMMITGLAEVEVQGDVKGMDNVGKKKVSEARSYHTTEHTSRKALETYIKENLQEEGWTLNASLNSQSSLKYDGVGGTTANYSVFKYVEDEQGEEK